MLTVRFIGFFSTFRKGNIGPRMQRALRLAAVILMAPFVLGPPLAAFAATNDEEEAAMIYHGRDSGGNRIFGSDHRAAPSFYTDPQSGDRHFHTPPPDPSASSSGAGPEYIFVTPELYPEGNWQNGQRPPDGKPGGKSGQKPGTRPGGKPGVKPGGKPGGRI